MPFRKISHDVKIAAVNLYERELLSLEDILDCCQLSRATFFRVLHLWRTTGDVVKPYNNPGRPRALVAEDVQYLLRLVQHRPDWFLDELANLMIENPSGIPGVAMKHYKALYSTVAPYHGSLVI